MQNSCTVTEWYALRDVRNDRFRFLNSVRFSRCTVPDAAARSIAPA